MAAEPNSLHHLRRDLDRLRRHNRLLAAFSALIGLALVLSVVFPVATTRSRRYELHDDRGRQRGMWRVRSEAPAMILQDDSGVWRAVTSVGADGARLDLNGTPGGGVAAAIELVAADSASLTMRDGQGRPRIRMTAADDGARLVFLDADGEIVSVLREPPR